MKVAKPVENILDNVVPHRIAMGVVKVDGITPRRFVVLGEVRCKVGGVVSLWSKMVINHVQDDGNALPMTGID